MHAIAPVVFCAVPAAQSTHTLFTSLVPTGHALQLFCPALGWIVPAGQGRHSKGGAVVLPPPVHAQPPTTEQVYDCAMHVLPQGFPVTQVLRQCVHSCLKNPGSRTPGMVAHSRSLVPVGALDSYSVLASHSLCTAGAATLATFGPPVGGVVIAALGA